MTTSPPEFGKDLEPTDDMIAKGKFGNGSYQSDNKALEIVRAEKRRLAIMRKEDRRNAYEAHVVETLQDIGDFQDALIQLGKKTAQDALSGEKDLTKTDLDVLGKALKAADQVSNRVLGLASRLDDKAPQQNPLSWMIEGEEATPDE